MYFLLFHYQNLGCHGFFIKNRKREKEWKRHLPVHLTGLTLCSTILTVTLIEKFTVGGWITLLITSILIGICYLIRNHYKNVQKSIRELDEMLSNFPTSGSMNSEALDPKKMTVIQLVSGFNGLGLHTLLSIIKNFPGLYKNFIFVSIGLVDSGSFKGIKEIEVLKESVKASLLEYVDLARRLGFPADYRFDIGTDVVESASALCRSIVEDFPKSTVFTGNLVFHQVRLFHKFLHNETAFAIQRRLQWSGITTVILPIRIKV